MTNISVETGLPELPEGYFWRVEKIQKPFAIERQLLVSIMKKETRTIHSTSRTWWGKRREAFTKASYEKCEQSLTVGYERQPEAVVKAEEVTPEMILQTAHKVLYTWELRKKAEMLIGDYPPKKLEVDKTDD